MTCPHCGAPVKGRFCEYCGTPVSPAEPPAAKPQPAPAPQVIIVNNAANPAPPYAPPVYPAQPVYPAYPVPAMPPKNKWAAFFLCFFLGFWGIHKFYEGKAGMGILYLFTMGLFGIGWLVDLIVLLTKPTYYYPRR